MKYGDIYDPAVTSGTTHVTHEVLTSVGYQKHPTAAHYVGTNEGGVVPPDVRPALESAGWRHFEDHYKGQYHVYTHPEHHFQLHVTRRGALYSPGYKPLATTPF